MPRPDIGRKLTSLRLEPDLQLMLDAEAAAEDRSRSEVIREIIRQHYFGRAA